MPFPSFDRSKRQATDAHPMQRRHVAGLVAVGAVVASSAFALPVLAQGGDAPSADASATVPTSVATTSLPTTTVIPGTTTSTTTAPAPAPDPTAVFAATVAGMTLQERVAFTIYTATPEERAAFFTFISPPPPPPPAPAPTPAPEPELAPAPVATAPAPGGFLACVRQRESKGNYSINTGNGYFGAYQFSQTTWNNTARHAGRGDLVGVRPSSVSPSDQDAMAQSLLAWQGRSPWAGPGC
jgi:hypothetical protein